MTATLEALLEQNKPGVLSKLCAKTVSFGKKPPMISDIRPFDDGQQHTGPRVMVCAGLLLCSVLLCGFIEWCTALVCGFVVVYRFVV